MDTQHPERIFTPGPTFIPARIHEAMRVSTMHHRTREFENIFHHVGMELQKFFSAELSPVLLACSGSGAMEASLFTMLRRGDEMLFLQAGKFGERWGDIARRHSVHAHELRVPWGESLRDETLEEALLAHPQARVLCLQHLETSTTVQHDVQQLAKVARNTRPDILIVVDAISSAATCPIPQDAWNIDVLIGGSQKAFMLPPGLSYVSFSVRALEFAQAQREQSPVASLYFDLLHEYEIQTSSRNSAWTPAMTLVLGLQEALRMLGEEGHEKVFERHARASQYVRQELRNLGFQTIADSHPAPGVTGAFPPAGISASALKNDLQERHAIKIAGGQDAWSGKIIRIGHMGYFTQEDVDVLLEAIETFCKKTREV